MKELGVDFYKIGSGDITWHEMLEYIAKKNKPMILATGASTLAEVDEAVKIIEATRNPHLIFFGKFPGFFMLLILMFKSLSQLSKKLF